MLRNVPASRNPRRQSLEPFIKGRPEGKEENHLSASEKGSRAQRPQNNSGEGLRDAKSAVKENPVSRLRATGGTGETKATEKMETCNLEWISNIEENSRKRANKKGLLDDQDLKCH